MASKQDILAEDLVRSYNHVRRFIGIRIDDDEGTWVLSRPGLPAERCVALARVLLAPRLERHALADAVGAREVRRLTPGALGKAWFHLGKLAGRDEIQALIDAGVRPLRSFRGRELAGVLDDCRDALEAAQGAPLPSGTLDDRLRLVFGQTGEQLAAAFRDAQRPDRAAVATRHGRLADFVETVERVVGGLGPARPELRGLWTQLSKLPDEPPARARALVSLLRHTAGGDAPHELGRRRRLEAQIRGLPLVEAARRLAEIAGLAEPEHEAPASPWTDNDRARLLALAIELRGTGLRLPREGGRKLQALLEIASELSGTNLQTLWPCVLELDQQKLDSSRWALISSDLPGDVLADGLELDVLGQLDEFDDERRARAYLDAVRRLRANPIANISPNADWFVAPFRNGRSWEPTLVLGLLAAHHKTPETLVATLTAIRDTGLANLEFADAMAAWNDPQVVERPAEWDEVGELLDLTVSDLERYLHWRRIAGHGETFSAAVRKPLDVAQREDQELAHLRALDPTPALQKRIAALESPDLRALRVEAASRRARKAFDRALDVLQRESLDAVLTATARSAFERLLGRRLNGELPERVRSLMFLVSADDVDHNAIRELLEDVLAGRDLRERQPNQKWLARVAARGVDTNRWLAGVDVTLNVRGVPIHVTTETDPLHVLEMGSYFDTCLSLESGFNAASTLTNAIDVNKQVLYGRRGDGTVIVRKLLAVTDDGGLLGYRTYAFENHFELDARLGAALAAFADECGLELRATGRPAALHDTFWYDDGVVGWRSSAPARQIPEWVPGDEAGAAEWAYVRGFEDPSAWEWGATLTYSSWRGACAARLHLHAVPGAAAIRHTEARRYLAARGQFDWIADDEDRGWHVLGDIYEVLPADPDALRRLVRALRVVPSAEPPWSNHVHFVSSSMAVLRPGEIAAYIGTHVQLARAGKQECFDEQHDDCLHTFVVRAADVLHASWLRHGPDDVDRLFGHRDPVIAAVAIELATRVSAPAFGRRVRASFKQTGPDGRIEWALARQEDDASKWLLESATVAKPDDARLAEAAAAFADLAKPMPTPETDQPTTAEMLQLVDGLFRAEPTDQALEFFLSGPRWLARAATLPFFATPAALVRAASKVEPILAFHAAELRHLIAAMPDDERVRALGTQSPWEWIDTFGADLALWKRHIHALLTIGQPRDALRLCECLATEIDPDLYETTITEFFDAHEAIVMNDAAAMLEILLSRGENQAPYRLIEILVHWAAPRADRDLTNGLDNHPRSAWLKQLWQRVRVGQNE